MTTTLEKKIPQNEDELRTEAYEALIAQLGLERATRIWQVLEPGVGNYTEERKKIFAGMSLDDIVEEMKKYQEEDK